MKRLFVILTLLVFGCNEKQPIVQKEVTPVQTRSYTQADSIFFKIWEVEKERANSLREFLMLNTSFQRIQLNKLKGDTLADHYNKVMLSNFTNQYVGSYDVVTYNNEKVDSFKVVRYKEGLKAVLGEQELPVTILSDQSVVVGNQYFTLGTIDTIKDVSIYYGLANAIIRK